nr:P27 family phage terminase small subunit [Ruthenibacterium lactatiformans]
MRKAAWKKKIMEQCEAVGTYRDAFLPVIETLACTLELRDGVYAAFCKDGSRAAVSYTNKAGAENMVKNPLLVQLDELNKSALGYWRDLGLTPAGLKKIDEKAMQAKKKTGVEKVLMELDG